MNLRTERLHALREEALNLQVSLAAARARLEAESTKDVRVSVVITNDFKSIRLSALSITTAIERTAVTDPWYLEGYTRLSFEVPGNLVEYYTGYLSACEGVQDVQVH